MFFLALLLHVQILGLLHPRGALVWPDGAAQPVEAQPGRTYGERRFAVEVRSPPKSKPARLRREYRGRLRVEDEGDGLRLINEVELEDYVASVVGAEIDAAPAAAREALAVVARTFAVRAEAGGHLCDTTHCQWYRGLKGADIESARWTAGEILLLPDGRPAPAFHSQDCGGHTSRARDVWSNAGEDEDQASLRSPDAHLPGLPKGSGHGVGLCQRGATFLATKGASAHQILARYFPRLHIGRHSLAF
jgi:peptidoglycan hydrolase-like amidase